MAAAKSPFLKKCLASCSELLASSLAVVALLILVWQANAAVQQLGVEIDS